VEQRRIGRPQGGRYGRVSFVSGRSDGVEAFVEAAQPARREVQVPARELGVEQAPRLLTGQRVPVPHRGLGVADGLRHRQRADFSAKPLIEVVIGGHIRQHVR
jgi:hypothetical protein